MGDARRDAKGKGIVEYSSSEYSDEDYVSSEDILGDDVDDVKDTGMSGGSENEQLDYSKLSYNEIMGREFSSLEEAETFYNEYARHVGFSVRMASFKKFANGFPRLRIMVCHREGRRKSSWVKLPGLKRKPPPDFRVDCKAAFQVNFDRIKEKWYVKNFVEDHTHPLAKPEHVNFLPSHRKIDEACKAEIRSMRRAGLRTCQIRNVMVMQSGGHQHVGFQSKDLYNEVQSAKGLTPPNGDTQSMLCFFTAKKQDDPGFYYRHTVLSDSCMGNLFWSDSVSRFDYSCFGDVIAFDSAFKRNRYNRPLVLVLGINHHHQTIIFGCGIIVNEATENYVWLLKQLEECMGGKRPAAVVTDGDYSMRRAIREVLPNACHRLCSWHLQRNVASRTKDPNFLTDFTRLMFSRISVDQFELEWDNLIECYDLSENEWIQELWESRSMWAESYLKDKFFGGTRTTSRCESMHASLDRSVERRLPFNEFVDKFDNVVGLIRHRETQLDHESSYGIPTCKTPFRELEVSAAKIFTLASLSFFQEQLLEVGAYIDYSKPVLEDGILNYFVSRFNSPSRFRHVTVLPAESKFWCECELLKSNGFPCRHILYVIKREMFGAIPNSLIMKRWTKDAKVGLPNEYSTLGAVKLDFIDDVRYGALCASFRSLCSLACKREDTYRRVREDIAQSAQGVSDLIHKHRFQHRPCDWDSIRDPEIPTKRDKAANKVPLQRKCSVCRETGHTKRRCPQLQSQSISDVETSPSLTVPGTWTEIMAGSSSLYGSSAASMYGGMHAEFVSDDSNFELGEVLPSVCYSSQDSHAVTLRDSSSVD